jgi:hypothetical protein
MEKKFASRADLAEKKISFVQLGEGVYATPPKAIHTGRDR